ncbi:cohesin domain-containing protein [Hespellia stercorisuis]|uniref:Cohesin domain-containing protein n=1 Tax=Hespellia stercorisuis DSM 15480 TaxID=1121950 RepID=A0A1M6Q6R6_9FIRM|nr:cohesin domain-containing protein [Hespellia stercorisuis]SHK15932.1 Cohesin domain-containing protein [Hespellia stercorisuis DSM 15480]
MKAVKKVSTGLAAVCLMFFCFTFASHAAEGTLVFSDPETTKGSEVTIDVKVTAGQAIGDSDINLTYDPAVLEFVSGTNATGGDGNVALSASGDGTVTELDYSIVFKALDEGSTTVDVAGYTAYLYSNEALTLTEGNATVTIGPGDGTETTGQSSGNGLQVDVKGTSYTIYEDFSDALIFQGFSRAEMQFEGAARKCLVQDAGGKYLFFLNDANNDSHMALYNESNGTFSFTEQIMITNDRYILLTDQGDGSDLPNKYKATTLTLNGNEFPAWQDSEETDFYLVYALNSLGKEEFYEYDKTEDTYQRYVVPAKVTVKNSTGLVNKITDAIEKNLTIILIVAWAVFLLLLIIIIVLSVKLKNRNRELDELYNNQYDDQYGEPTDSYDGYDDDMAYNDDEDDAYYEDDDSDEYEDDDDEYYDDEDDDEYYDDEDDENYDDEDDDYEVDFVDLDD